MAEETLVILQIGGTIIVAVIALGGVVLANILLRLNHVEGQLKRTRKYTHSLWIWARTTMDIYYRYRVAGSPDLPRLPNEPDD